MLEIKTPYKKGDALCLVLDNLNEIVGRFVEDDNDSITLGCVRLVAPSMNQQTGAMQVGLQALVLTSKDGQNGELKFPKNKILTTTKALDSVNEQLRQEDSGIQLGG